MGKFYLCNWGFICILGIDSFVGCMNLLVCCFKVRCGGGGLGINFGFLMRVKRFLLVLSEFGDELNGIIELDCIVEVF